MRTIKLIQICLLSLICLQVSANNQENPCGESSDLLSLLDRPSIAFSACVVPKEHVLIESGYTYLKLTDYGF